MKNNTKEFIIEHIEYLKLIVEKFSKIYNIKSEEL